MIAHGTLLKEELGPEVKVVFFRTVYRKKEGVYGSQT